MVRMISAVAAMALLAGCRADGQNGDLGKVRFSQVVNFAETSDFSAPMALNKAVLIKLEHPAALLQTTEEARFPELALKVVTGSAEVLGLGFAQFAVSPSATGALRLAAEDGATVVDGLSATVADIDHLRTSAKATMLTSTPAGADKSCVQSSSVDAATVTLRRNQSVSWTVVPVDSKSAPMLGLLSLTAHASSTVVSLDTPLFLEDGVPNTITMSPVGKLGETVTLKIDEADGKSLSISVTTADEDAPITCQQ